MSDPLCPYCGWPINATNTHRDDRVNGIGTITCATSDNAGNHRTLYTVFDPPPARLYFSKVFDPLRWE